jgi:hypothetical protein
VQNSFWANLFWCTYLCGSLVLISLNSFNIFFSGGQPGRKVDLQRKRRVTLRGSGVVNGEWTFCRLRFERWITTRGYFGFASRDLLLCLPSFLAEAKTAPTGWSLSSAWYCRNVLKTRRREWANCRFEEDNDFSSLSLQLQRNTGKLKILTKKNKFKMG